MGMMKHLPASPGRQAFIARCIDEANKVVVHKHVTGQASGSDVVNALVRAIRKEEPRKHVKLTEELSKVTLLGCCSAVLPSGAVCDELATSIDKLKLKHVKTPFVYVDLRKFLPHWACVDSGEDSEDSEGEASMLKKIACAVQQQPQDKKHYKWSMTTWAIAYDRYALAAAATKQLSYSAALAHKTICFQVAMRAKSGGRFTVMAQVYDEVARKSWEEKSYHGVAGFAVDAAAGVLDRLSLRS